MERYDFIAFYNLQVYILNYIGICFDRVWRTLTLLSISRALCKLKENGKEIRSDARDCQLRERLADFHLSSAKSLINIVAKKRESKRVAI